MPPSRTKDQLEGSGRVPSPLVGNPIASILKSNVLGIPALFGLHPVSNLIQFTVVGNVVVYDTTNSRGTRAGGGVGIPQRNDSGLNTTVDR